MVSVLVESEPQYMEFPESRSINGLLVHKGLTPLDHILIVALII